MTCPHYWVITTFFVCSLCGVTEQSVPSISRELLSCDHLWNTKQKWVCQLCGEKKECSPYFIPLDEETGFAVPKMRRGRQSKYTEAQREKVRAEYLKGGRSQKEVGAALGIPKSSVHRLLNGG